MKNHWLRSMLLGVSMAVLLAGGVALAASLDASVNKQCVLCWPGEEWPTDEAYLLDVTFIRWDPAYEICMRWTIDGQLPVPASCEWFANTHPFPQPRTQTLFFPCEWPLDATAPESVLGREVSAAAQPPGLLGEWNLRVWQVETGESVQVSWLVVKDVSECAALEFVPEPGSILLLGSGLAGLAGYATLRWKTREQGFD